MRIRSHRGSFQCRNVSLILFMSDVGLSKQSFIAITQNIANLQKSHCVISLQIQSFFWSVFSCIQSKYRKIRTMRNSVFGHFSCGVPQELWLHTPLFPPYKYWNILEMFRGAIRRTSVKRLLGFIMHGVAVYFVWKTCLINIKRNLLLGGQTFACFIFK